MVKPIKIALLLIGIQLILGALVWYFPKEGIPLFGDQALTFAQPKDFLPDQIKKIQVVEAIHETYSIKELSDQALHANIDSALLDEPLIISEKERIIHPSDFENGLFTFYNKLQNLNKENKPLRILHFGDSQIEGDRISGIIRENLQSLFGGCGVGFIPISESNFGRRSVLNKASGWERYQMFGQGQHGKHNKYGFMGYYHRVDSSAKATIQLRKNNNYFPKAQEFEELSILYGNAPNAVTYELSTDTGTIKMGVLDSTTSVARSVWELSGFNDKKINIALNGRLRDVYGVSMDCKKGVALDNIPLRGSSGTEFTKINKQHLAQQLTQLNVGLIIYQFGVNVVPSELNDYTFYENMVYNQLKRLKEILPDVAILVIGVSDMSRKDGDDYISYPNIVKIRAAQMNAAKRAGCAFWDLYNVMGGENSMPSWVFSQPSLAEKDFTHFNTRGAKVIGDKLFNALISDYYDFKSTNF